jgi:SAM-dependent methyltransferase
MEARSICGETVLAALRSLGLIRPSKQDPSAVVCPVWLYPANGFVVVSDRRDDPDGGAYTPPEDVVFPAIYAGTLRFLRLLPEAHGAEALDHCGGSGIGALHLARTVRRAVTADLTERSAFFAQFNGRLNGVEIESLCGDLYAPVQGRQFDLITAHPPFVPATGPNMVYRDGGETGEEVTRRLIEGLPAHLRPGGTCVVLCVARDTREAAFEARACEWLGANRSEFDVVFGLERVLTVEGVVESMRKRGQQISDEEARELHARLRSLGTKQFVYGALFVRRYAAPINAKPFRIGLTPNGKAADFDRLFAWRQHGRKPGFGEWLNESRPRFAPRIQLTARHAVHEGELVPAEFVFSIADGLEAALRPDPWIVPLIARLNGSRSVREVYESARQSDELPQGFRLDDFAGLIGNMIERGFLQVDL